jgi:putative flippase GtrA
MFTDFSQTTEVSSIHFSGICPCTLFGYDLVSGTHWSGREVGMAKLQLAEKMTFLAVGGMSGVCYVALASAIHFFGLSPVPSSAAAYAICLPFAYAGQRRLTFRSTRSHGVALIRYLVTQGVGGAIAASTTYAASSLVGLPAILAFILSGAAAAVASYLLQKFWVF